MAEPKCPSCGCTGIENFVSKASNDTAKNGTAWFYVVHCDQCGHVYDIMAKHTFSANPSKLVMPDIRR